MTVGIRGKCGNHRSIGCCTLIYVVHGTSQGVGAVSLSDGYVSRSFCQSYRVFFWLQGLYFDYDVIRAGAFRGNRTNGVSAAIQIAAVPHQILTIVIAPIKSDMIVLARIWRSAVPHQYDVALFQNTAVEHFAFCLESIGC